MSHPQLGDHRLDTVSVRLRVTASVIGVLAVVLIVLGLAVNAVFVAQSDRNLDALLSGRVQLARQLARTGVGPAQIVNRVDADGVQAYLVLANGTSFGTQVATGSQVKLASATLAGGGRVDGARLTLAVDTSLVGEARTTLRRVLLACGLAALVVSAVLVAAAVRLALRPLDAMARLAKTVTGGDRGRRLSPRRTDTEIGQTAQAFDEMLDELEGAEARARHAEERTRGFLADAAHELRTPITGVQAAAETLLQHGDQLDRDQREQLEVLLIREARRAGTLVSDLLTAARLDAGIELERSMVSMLDLVTVEVDRARLLHPEAAITLDGPEVAVQADADKLTSVLRNLVDNALRAAGPAGGVHLTLRGLDDQVLVEVWDTGPGVAPEDRQRIFDRLIRLDHGRAHDAGGSGLGLAIARGYARAHGGDLTCEDPRGPGAVFVLSLPTAAHRAGRSAPRGP